MLPEWLLEKYKKEGSLQCEKCGIYSKNGKLCRKCFDEKYPVLEKDYRIDYYKMNVHQYSIKYNLPISVSAMEINRSVSDSWDEFALEYVKKEKDAIKKKWFLWGYVIGSAVVGALLQIF